MKKVLFLVLTLICGVGFIAPVSAITLEEYKHTFLDEIPTDWRNFKNISQAKSLVP